MSIISGPEPTTLEGWKERAQLATRALNRAENMARWSTRTMTGLAVGAGLFVAAGAIMIFVLFYRVLPSQTAIQNGSTPAAIASRQDKAEQHYAVCAKSRSAVAAGKWDDFKDSCIGYGSLAEAYRTQHVTPRKKETNR